MASLSVIWDQRDLLPLSSQDFGRQCADSRLATATDLYQLHMGLWAMLFVPAQCERLSVQPQVRIPYLQGVGAKSKDQTQAKTEA